MNSRLTEMHAATQPGANSNAGISSEGSPQCGISIRPMSAQGSKPCKAQNEQMSSDLSPKADLRGRVAFDHAPVFKIGQRFDRLVDPLVDAHQILPRLR
jgi:hypothetical protein